VGSERTSDPAGPGGDEARALAAIDRHRLAHDLGRLVRAASPTGRERGAIECLAQLCEEHGLQLAVHEHDLTALRAHPSYPGEEAERDELIGLEAVLPASGTRRLCLAGHVDVVGPGTEPWARTAWSGELSQGCVHGRGALDMKAGVVAILHAIAAVQAACGQEGPCEVVFLGVSSEEDGGLGAFAALERDAEFDACVIPEPTDFRVVCTHAGALTFRGTVTGIGAHAAFRLAGHSAIERYVPVHRALEALEHAMNDGVEHPLMAELTLPYPLSVGRLQAGTWSSQVPDRLEFAGRVGVPVGVSPDEVRAQVTAAVSEAAGPGPPVELDWIGGQFASASTPTDHPLTRLVADALGAEVCGGSPAPLAGISYGADMRLFTERGIPCVMAGPGDTQLAHAVNERVAVDDVVTTARTLVRTIFAFGRAESIPGLVSEAAAGGP
jgi:acetylornithine deacetylase